MKVMKNMALLGLLCSGCSMMAMDEDEAFKSAIAESLKESEEYPAGHAEREAQEEAEFQEQMRESIAASQQEMAGSQAGQTQMSMTSFGQGSSSRQPQVTNSNRPLLTREEAATKIQKFYKRKKLERKKLAGAGIRIFEPLGLVLETYPNTNPTAEALADLLNTHEQDKDYIAGLPKVIVKKINFGGAFHRAQFAAYQDTEIPGEKPLLFLKISNDPSMPEKLDALQKGPVGRFGFMARSNKELPIIALQEVFFIYKDQMGNKHTIEVMHPAPGKTLSELMEDPQEDHYAEKVGKALGLFHVYFMNYHNSGDPKDWRTMIHGDFSAGNVFFDKTTSRVYFIDNGGMREEERPLKDLIMLGMPLALQPILRDPNRNWWSYFMKGYLSAYPVDKRKLMLDYLTKQFNTLSIPPIRTGF